jgi:hypothetical protein
MNESCTYVNKWLARFTVIGGSLLRLAAMAIVAVRDGRLWYNAGKAMTETSRRIWDSSESALMVRGASGHPLNITPEPNAERLMFWGSEVFETLPGTLASK